MLTRKIAVVTGASSGIGEVYADRLAQRGYDLVLVARRVDRLEEVAARLNVKHGAQVRVLQADLTQEEGLLAVEALLQNEKIALLVNNAGWAKFESFAEGAPDDSIAQIALNVTALTRLTQAVLPAFLARNEGVIINIASVLSVHSLPTTAVYSGTKGYVMNFTRGLQDELAGTGIQVQLVLPATTATEIWTKAGIDLNTLSHAMDTETLVDAALAGLDLGEAITWPNLADIGLWNAYDDARLKLFAATRTALPAPRYAAPESCSV